MASLTYGFSAFKQRQKNFVDRASEDIDGNGSPTESTPYDCNTHDVCACLLCTAEDGALDALLHSWWGGVGVAIELAVNSWDG